MSACKIESLAMIPNWHCDRNNNHRTFICLVTFGHDAIGIKPYFGLGSLFFKFSIFNKNLTLPNQFQSFDLWAY